MSSFSGLNTATTALWAAQRGLDVTGQNIANVNTDGYSRQRVELQSVNGNTVPAIHSVSNQVGQGVDADTVIRIRDAFLESRAQAERANSARLTAESAGLSAVENALREPGSSGIQSMLADMWDGWSDVANHPEDLAARSQLLQRTETLVSGLRTADGVLGAEWEKTRDNLDALVADVNAAARSIADLNAAIQKASRAGLPVNELADKRDVFVLQLAEKVGATGRAGADGQVDVSIGGTSLVTGDTATALELTGTTDSRSAAPGDPRLVTRPGGTTVRPGGTAEGQLSVLGTILPGYRGRLDAIASQVARTLNDAQAGTGTEPAYDLDGDVGGPMVDDGTGAVTVDPATVTAANIRLRLTRPQDVAAALLAPDAAGPSLDGGNAAAAHRLRLDQTGVDATYRALVVDLGVQAAVVARNSDIQDVITAQVDSARESVSGVNLDEEMTRMMSFQHAYSAAARMVTAIDESLDVLINRMGRVGL
ncbi:flagellar hook-associated protein FlgK [Geodermatophilus arenarius]|uniref:Flagellar hook-associated protein 1 n=1 Tax=Geodermatophilus arenarius TaxID=1137990 RepID=A0ABV9LPH1_9ACTN